MSSFAYSVAIRLTVANLASQGVRLLAKDLMAAHGSAVKLQDKLSALKMIAVGYGMEKAGQGILGFLGKAVDGSKEYTNQIAQMNAAGFTHLELAQSIGAAWRTSGQVITSTATENLKTIRELRSAFGAGEGMQHAYAMLPIVDRVNAIMTSMTGKEQHNVGYDMTKAIEFATKGAPNVTGMVKQAEMMTKALIAFGGTLTVSDFHQTFKASKTAAPYMSDDFKYNILPTIMQEMKSGQGGAQAAGTAIATLFGTIKGHAIMTRMIPAWQMGGLIAPGGIQKDAHHKGMSRIMPGGIAGENLFTQNPEEWAVKYLIPARDKIMAKMHVDEVGAYYSLTGNRNTAFMFQTLANKGAQFARDRELINRSQGSYGAYQTLLKQSPELAQQAMASQWQNLLAIIGFQILPKMIPFMVKFAEGLNVISDWMAKHPLRSSSLVLGLGALGIGLDLAGKAMMAAGIIKFLGMGGILTSIGGAAAAAAVPLVILAGSAFIVYRNWNSILPRLKELWSIITMAGRGLLEVMGPLGQAFNFLVTHLAQLMKAVGNLGMQIPSPLSLVGRGIGAGIDAIYHAIHPTVIHTQVNLDGRQIAHVVTKHQTKAATRMPTGGTGFDGSRSMASVAGAL